MAALLALVRVLLPVLLEGAERGTLLEIVATGLKLVGLVRPLLSDSRTLATIDGIAASLSAAPAQPEDPVFAREGGPKFGGR